MFSCSQRACNNLLNVAARGKEVDQENIDLMMNILKRDFSENQIIIASIYCYSFPEIHEIELKENLIDQLVVNKEDI